MTEVNKTILISSNKAHLNEFVHVKVNYANDKLRLTDQKIIDFVKFIYQTEYNYGHLVKDIEISGEEPLQYTVIREEKTENKTPLSDLRVKVLQASEKALPMRAKTIHEIYLSLHDTWVGKIPLIQHFWTLVTYPLAIFIRAFSPAIRDLSELNKQKFPDDENAVLTAFKWSREAVDMPVEEDPLYALGEQFTLPKQLAEAEAIGRDWHDPSKRTLLPDTCVKEIMSRLGQDTKSIKQAVNLMLIPTGYWLKGVYQPVILSFYKDVEGKLCLSEMSYGAKGEGTTSQDYRWEDIKKDQLGILLTTLMNRANKPSVEEPFSYGTWLGRSLVEQIKEDLTIEGKKDLDKLIEQIGNRDQPIDDKPITDEEFRKKMLLSHGATLLKPREGRRDKIRKDPYKLIHETIKLSFPGSSLSDKTTFTLGILSDRLEKVISGLSAMGDEEKVRWVELLEKDVRNFEKHLRKTFGNEEAIERLLRKESPFKKLFQRVQELKVEVDNLPSQLAKRRSERADKLNHPKEGHYTLEVSTDITPIGEITTSKSQQTKGITSEDVRWWRMSRLAGRSLMSITLKRP